MKKSIFIIGFVLVALLTAVSVYAYQTIRDPLANGFEQAEQYILSKSLLANVSDVNYYHGTEAYFVFKGKNQEGDEVIIWVTDDLVSHHVEKSSDGISKEEALAIVQSEANVARIKSIRLGYERDIPIYEITYTDQEQRQAYYYLTFEDGTFMKRYQIRTN